MTSIAIKVVAMVPWLLYHCLVPEDDCFCSLKFCKTFFSFNCGGLISLVTCNDHTDICSFNTEFLRIIGPKFIFLISFVYIHTYMNTCMLQLLQVDNRSRSAPSCYLCTTDLIAWTVNYTHL